MTGFPEGFFNVFPPGVKATIDSFGAEDPPFKKLEGFLGEGGEGFNLGALAGAVFGFDTGLELAFMRALGARRACFAIHAYLPKPYHADRAARSRLTLNFARFLGNYNYKDLAGLEKYFLFPPLDKADAGV